MEREQTSLDQIHIRDLFLRCIIGINPEERDKRQDVLINITLFAELSKACHSDNVEDTINYKLIKYRVVEWVEHSSCRLVEHLAQRIADICLEDRQVQQARVSVEKPGALRFARSVGVEIFRSQSKGDL